nr:TIGR04211 family SH3 domain-containing protein [uncultured Pseudomonas sp.]
MPESRPALSVRPALRGSLLACLIALAAPVQAEQPSSERWVSDSLSTYVRSGPTNGHRIVGSLKAGEKVSLVDTQGNYSQIRGQNGDLVWILNSDLQAVPGQAERLPALDGKVTQLSEQLKTIDDSWKARVQGMQETLDSRKTLADELEVRNKDLTQQLDQAQSALRDAQAQLGDENKQVMMRYMVYGGSIAGAGLLLGLILPALTRGRKRNDRWF